MQNGYGGLLTGGLKRLVMAAADGRVEKTGHGSLLTGGLRRLVMAAC